MDMANMQETIRDLNLIRIEACKLQKELEASTLWKKYNSARRKEGQLEHQLKKLQFGARKAELEELGFECLTGYDYEDYDHKYAIVHKDCPHILSLFHDGAEWEVGMKGLTGLPRDANDLILCTSDTETGAWERAIFEWYDLFSHYAKDCMLGKV